MQTKNTAPGVTNCGQMLFLQKNATIVGSAWNWHKEHLHGYVNWNGMLLDYIKDCRLLGVLDEPFVCNSLLVELKLGSYKKREKCFGFSDCLNLLSGLRK